MAHYIQSTRAQPFAAATRLPVVRVLAQMMATSRQRRTLASLEDHLLEDIGISRQEAMKEATKAPWDAPRSWYF